MTSLTANGFVRGLPVPALLASSRRGLVSRVGEWMCALSGDGHELIRKTEGRRMYLTCRKCLHETPGWTIEKK